VSTADIVLVASNFPPVRGGSASVYAELARCANGRVKVLAPKVNYVDGLPIIGWREYDRQAPFRIQRIPLLRTILGKEPKNGLQKMLFRLSDLVIRLRAAITLLRSIMDGARVICIGELLASSWIIAIFGRIPGVRIVAYVHGEEITTRDSADPGNRIGRVALQRCDVAIVVSRFTKTVVEDLLGEVPDRKIRLIENGVDNRRFTPGERSAALLELYGLESRFVFISVCRLVERKGIDRAISAFARVMCTHPDSRYLVVGDGPYANELKKIACAEGVAHAVIFTGQVAEEELVEHYRLGHVFVMPNRRLPNGDTEGFGLVFLEANSCGLPVIAGCEGGSTDAVKDGFNGLVVDGHSVDSIAAAMRRLRDEPGLYATVHHQALQAARQAAWEEKTRAFLTVCKGD
jgi:phosphatidylinositol alpha-1,6-mannosyltransferase